MSQIYRFWCNINPDIELESIGNYLSLGLLSFLGTLQFTQVYLFHNNSFSQISPSTNVNAVDTGVQLYTSLLGVSIPVVTCTFVPIAFMQENRPEELPLLPKVKSNLDKS